MLRRPLRTLLSCLVVAGAVACGHEDVSDVDHATVGDAPISTADVVAISAHEFGRISGVVIAPDGRVFVADAMEFSIVVLDSAGTVLTTIGAPGDGPGEFRSISDIALAGDSLVVLDYMLQRLTTFAVGEGANVTLGSSRSMILPDRRARLEIDATRQGFMYVPYRSATMRNGVAASDRLSIRRIPPGGRASEGDSILNIPDREWLITRSATGVTVESMPFGKEPVVRVIDDTTLLVGWSGEPSFTFRTTDGTVRSQYALPIDPAPVTQEVVDEYVLSIETSGDPLARFTVERVERAWQEGRLPATFPAYRDVIADQSGAIWISAISSTARLVRRPWGTEIVERGDSIEYFVLRNGAIDARVHVPAHRRILAVRGSFGVAVSVDSLGVEVLEIVNFNGES